MKRLVASFVIAGRDSGFDSGEREEIARFCTEKYRDAMRSYASSGLLEVWYAYRSAQDGPRPPAGGSGREGTQEAGQGARRKGPREGFAPRAREAGRKKWAASTRSWRIRRGSFRRAGCVT